MVTQLNETQLANFHFCRGDVNSVESSKHDLPILKLLYVMFCRAKISSSEIVCVSMVKTICLPGLLYAFEVPRITNSNISM